MLCSIVQTHWGKCRAKVINYHTSHHIPIAEAPWLLRELAIDQVNQRDSHQPANRSAIPPLTTPFHHSSAVWNRGRLVNHLPLFTWHLTSGYLGGMQKLTGTNYVWEGGRLKSRSTNVEEAWKSHAICQTAAMKCVLSWVSQFIITIIIQDVYVHTSAMSYGVQSIEYITLYTSALTEQFTTIHSFMQRGCRPQQIPLSVQPSYCQCESSERSISVLMVSICGHNFFYPLKNPRHYYCKGNEDEMENVYNETLQKQYVVETTLVTETLMIVTLLIIKYNIKLSFR